jgi:hypothetical protein
MIGIRLHHIVYVDQVLLLLSYDDVFLKHDDSDDSDFE